MKILVLEPYYGGSHQAFLDGLCRHLPYRFELMTMPAHSWKWRMRLAAPCFAGQLAEANRSAFDYDRILCSSLIDVASLRGLLPEGFRRLPILCYFHENQFAYPVRVEDSRDVHFALTNFTSALAADRLAFNSHYNLTSFLDGCKALFKKRPEMEPIGYREAILAKSTVLYPGLNLAALEPPAVPAAKSGPPLILWNHRWEHDKDPESFFTALYSLVERGVDFRLAVVGASFRAQPSIFAEARRRLARQIVQFGFLESRRAYADLLHQADLVVSTARHEFYGIAVLEAVACACRPLVPDRLSYPELFEPTYRYRDGALAERMVSALGEGRLSEEEAGRMGGRFAWPELLAAYRHWLEGSDC